MLATVCCSAVHGIDAYTVSVEVDVQQAQTDVFSVVGLPGAEVDRVRGPVE
jgi:hypothetical protein